jgi:hypothetical protein
MQPSAIAGPAFVIKVEDLFALNYLASDHPRPRMVEWINRGSDQRLKRSTIAMLTRTLFGGANSDSVVRLHHSSGLRAIFGTENERNLFAKALSTAQDTELAGKQHLVTAVFDGGKDAEAAVSQLKDAGLPDASIAVLWRTSKFLDAHSKWFQGHSKLSVASAAAGGGVAGAMLSIAFVAIPGVGPVAAAGTIATSVLPSIAAFSGIMGATGGAFARMLTDHDVDGVSAKYYAQQIQRGKIFVSVDTRMAETGRDEVRRILVQNGGRTGDGAFEA